MKNVSIVLNVVLVIAVGVLFYLHFKGGKPVSVQGKVLTDSASPGSFKIVYFEVDSLDNKYEYLKEVRESLRRKEAAATNEIRQMETRFNNKVKEYQQKGAGMSQSEQMAAQQDLQRMQEEYQSVSSEKEKELNAEKMHRMQQVKMKVQDFLKEYSAKHGYAFVYAADSMDNIYYKDPTRDITAEVISLLNEQYKTEKKK